MYARALLAAARSYPFTSMPHAEAVSMLRSMGRTAETAAAVVSHALLHGTLERDGEMLRVPREDA